MLEPGQNYFNAVCAEQVAIFRCDPRAGEDDVSRIGLRIENHAAATESI